MSELVRVRVVRTDGDREPNLQSIRAHEAAEHQRVASRLNAEHSSPVAATPHDREARFLDPEQVREISERTRAQLLASPAFRNSRAGRRLIAKQPELFPDLDK